MSTSAPWHPMDSTLRPESILQRMLTAQGFDSVAPRYDHETESNPIILWARRQTLRRLTSLFAPGANPLEIGCGTGVEAVSLAQAGRCVVATDPSPGMLAAAARRVTQAGMDDRIQLHNLAAAELGSLLRQFQAGSFAGAYSGFGPLNCEPELRRTAAALHMLLAPNGRLVVSVINRFHPFEFAWYAAHSDLGRATRRWGGRADGTVSPALPDTVSTLYYTPRSFARQLAPYFRVVHYRALLLTLPPPYLAHLVQRYPHVARRAARLERSLAGLPLLRGLGDHFWMELERVQTVEHG